MSDVTLFSGSDWLAGSVWTGWGNIPVIILAISCCSTLREKWQHTAIVALCYDDDNMSLAIQPLTPSTDATINETKCWPEHSMSKETVIL